MDAKARGEERRDRERGDVDRALVGRLCHVDLGGHKIREGEKGANEEEGEEGAEEEDLHCVGA